MRIVLTFALNAGLNLVLSLALAGVLGPEGFGRFAVAAMVVIVLATAAFEWLRLSTTRFVSGGADDPSLKASLDLGYGAIAFVLLVSAAAIATARLDLGLDATTLGWVTLAAIANGTFEYRAALARALFLDRAYFRLVVVRNLLAFALMVGAALWFRSVDWVLAMLALSAAVAALSLRVPGGQTVRLSSIWQGASGARLAGFARYGVPIVAANLIYQAIVLLNRGVASAAYGYAEAGQISLSTDITIRLLLSAGAALDVFLFQTAVRRAAQDGDAAGRAGVARNMTLVAAILVLLALGWVMALPAFEALVVPQRYVGDFARICTIMTPGVLAFCLVQFALNPVFQLGGRTLAILWTALVVPAVDVALLAVRPEALGVDGIAVAHSGGLVAALLAALWFARHERGCWPALRDLGGLLLAAVLAALAMWPGRMMASPVAALAWAGLVGPAIYGGVLLALDVGRVRALANGVLPRRMRVLPGRAASRETGP